MDWKDFLLNVSATVIGSNDLLTDFKEHKTSGWLGYPGITDDEISKHEKRLGINLPPSYKEFLRVSNGFKQLSCFIWDIMPLQKVEWLKTFDDEFYQLYAFQFDFDVDDQQYFDYSENQSTVHFRSKYLIDTLAISNWGDSAILLLNPHVKFGDEWEAWIFANWYPGARRYRSFEELMKDEFAGYVELKKKQTE